MDSYTENASNNLVLSNEAYINEIKNNSYLEQNSVYQYRTSYLEMANKTLDDIGNRLDHSISDIEDIQDRNNSLSLSSKSNKLLLQIDNLYKIKGQLNLKDVQGFNEEAEKLISSYRGRISNNRLMDIAVLPLRNRLSNVLADNTAFHVRDLITNLTSPYRQFSSVDQFNQAMDDMNAPHVDEYGKSIYGTSNWMAIKNTATDAWLKSLMVSAHTKTQAETVDLINKVSDRLPPNIVNKYKRDLTSVFDAQQFAQDNMGLPKSSDEAVNQQEAKYVASGISTIRENKGNIRLDNLIGTVTKDNSAPMLRYLTLLNHELSKTGDTDVWDNLVANNPQNLVALTYINRGMLNDKNYKSLNGYPLLNSTNNIDNLTRLDAGLTISRGGENEQYLLARADLFGGITEAVSNKVFYKARGSQEIISAIYSIGVNRENMNDIKLANNRLFQQWRMNNTDLTRADLIKASQEGKLDVTRSPEGKFSAGTQQSALGVEYDRYVTDGGMADIAVKNVVDGYSKALTDELKKRGTKDALIKTTIDNSEIRTKTNLGLNVLLLNAYGTNGFTVANRGGETYVVINNQSYNLNNSAQANTLMSNAFKTIGLQASSKSNQKILKPLLNPISPNS